MGLNDKGQLLFKDANNKFVHQSYLFDSVSILSHLTYVFTHTPILVRSLLKHKEGKTLKFIFRNLFFLLALTVDNKKLKTTDLKSEYDFTLWFDNRLTNFSKRKIEFITEFFKRVMFDNPHLTHSEKKTKQEARQIFVKEVLKNLCEHHNSQASINSKYPNWPQLKLIFNLGAMWLISIVLKDEEKEDILDQKKLDPIVVNMQKYRNSFRQCIIKSLINEC